MTTVTLILKESIQVDDIKMHFGCIKQLKLLTPDVLPILYWSSALRSFGINSPRSSIKGWISTKKFFSYSNYPCRFRIRNRRLPSRESVCPTAHSWRRSCRQGRALVLARKGFRPRIIDSAEQPSEHSKALAVNPRTLEILEPTGITEKMLKIGRRIREVQFRFADKPPTLLSLQQLKHKYPFMLALSQATTERLLNEALEAAGGKVERGCRPNRSRPSIGDSLVIGKI